MLKKSDIEKILLCDWKYLNLNPMIVPFLNFLDNVPKNKFDTSLINDVDFCDIWNNDPRTNLVIKSNFLIYDADFIGKKIQIIYLINSDGWFGIDSSKRIIALTDEWRIIIRMNGNPFYKQDYITLIDDYSNLEKFKKDLMFFKLFS